MIKRKAMQEVLRATMINTQAIAKMESQIGQIATHLGEREKGKFLSQPVPNPKAFAIGNSSHENSLERQVDNKLGQEEEDLVVQQGKESGRDNGEKLSLLEPYPLLRSPRGCLSQKLHILRD